MIVCEWSSKEFLAMSKLFRGLFILVFFVFICGPGVWADDSNGKDSVIQKNIHPYPLTYREKPIGYSEKPNSYREFPLGFREKLLDFVEFPPGFREKQIGQLEEPRGFRISPPNFIEKDSHPLADNDPSHQISESGHPAANSDPLLRINQQNHPVAKKDGSGEIAYS